MLSQFGIPHTAPEINICPVPDMVSGSRHFVRVTRNLCWSSVYDILLKFENESCRSHMKSCQAVTDDRWLFHALQCFKKTDKALSYILVESPKYHFHTYSQCTGI